MKKELSVIPTLASPSWVKRSKAIGFIGAILAFVTFGLGSLILTWGVFPLSYLRFSSLEVRQQWNRKCIFHAFRFYLKLLVFLNVLKLEVSTLNNLPEQHSGALLIANHPTLLDVVVIMGTIKNLQCVVKGQLWKNFFLRGVVKGAGFLSNELEPQIFIDRCHRYLETRTSILVFPEGTRTALGKSPHFLRSFAHMALALGVDIIPLVITCSPSFLSKEIKWYSILPVCPVLSIFLGRPFHLDSFDPSLPRPRRARLMVQTVQHYYETFLEDPYGNVDKRN